MAAGAIRGAYSSGAYSSGGEDVVGSAGAVALEKKLVVDDEFPTMMRGAPRLPVVVHGAPAVLPV